MSASLHGPDDRYRVSIDVLAARGNDGAFASHTITEGEPVWDLGGQGGCYLVLAGEDCSLVLAPGENGLLLRSVRLLGAGRAVVTATVTPGGGAPDWLPNESTYLLFQGDRDAAAAVRDRYIPLDNMTTEQVIAVAQAAPPGPAAPPGEAALPAPAAGGATATLDQLAVAVGRSIARANAVLARTQADAGVGLVSHVTFRVCVTQTDLGQGRVLVTLARPDEGCSQFVELTMTTVPGSAAPSATTAGT